jgi:hypothetical protein
MLLCLIGLSVLSVIMLIIGAVWTLVISGHTQTRSGPQVGAEIMAGQTTEDEGHIVAQRTFFKGKATKIESEAEFSLAEIKELVRTGQWRLAFPILMAIGGMFGLLLFGSCAFLFGVGGLVGLLAVGITWFTVIRILIDFAKA